MVGRFLPASPTFRIVAILKNWSVEMLYVRLPYSGKDIRDVQEERAVKIQDDIMTV